MRKRRLQRFGRLGQSDHFQFQWRILRFLCFLLFKCISPIRSFSTASGSSNLPFVNPLMSAHPQIGKFLAAISGGLRLGMLTGGWCLLCPIAIAAPWTATTSLPEGFTEHSMSYASGFLYHAGGFGPDNGESDKVYYSQVQANGTLGAWNVTAPLPAIVLDHAGLAANGFVYVLGGNHYTPDGSDYGGYFTISNIVYYAKINANGSLGSWSTAAPLPQPVYFHSAASWNGRIYVIGGWNGSTLSNAVYSANILVDGSLSPWVVQRALPDPIYTQAQVSNGFLYVLGGVVNGGTQIQNNVYYSRINADGTLGPWNSGTPLPQPLSQTAAVAAGGRVFVMGGANGASPTNGFYSAPVGADGALGS